MLKNILIIDPADFIGGAERFTMDILKYLDHKEYHVLLATGDNPDYLALAKKRNISIVHIEMKRLKHLSFRSFQRLFHAVFSLRNIIASHKIDLIHSNSIRAHICAALAVLFMPHPKLIWFIHDFTFTNFFLRLLIRIPSNIVVANHTVRDFYFQRLPKRFHSKFILIPNGIDIEKTQQLSTVKHDIKKELNLGDNLSLVGIVGRIDHWKGQDHFLRAASKVHARLPKTRFLIIGTSSGHDLATQAFEQKIHQLVNDLNLERVVYFLGYRADVFELMAQLDVLVHASCEMEPFGRVVLEGMSVGTPVIASPLGGPSEMIEDGRNGFLVDPRDHEALSKTISRIIEHPDLQEKLKKNGLRSVQKHYDLCKVVRRIEKLYEGNSVS